MTDIHAQVHAYVVDALDPEETRDYERHLVDCADCTHEVAELRELTASLSRQVAAEPPPSLRASVLNAIATVPQDVVPVSVTPIRRREDRRHTTPGTGSRRPNRWTTALVAASVLAALGFGGWAVQSQMDLEESRRDAQAVAAQNAALTRLLAADDVRLARGDFTNGGGGVVVLSESEGAAMLLGRDLPALPDDKVYEAWTIDGSPVPAGTFTPDEGSESVLELPDETFEAKSLAVTIEPEGGSQQPTSDAVFTVVIPKR